MQHQEQPTQQGIPTQIENPQQQLEPMTDAVSLTSQQVDLDETMKNSLRIAKSVLQILIVLVHQKRASGAPDGDLECILQNISTLVQNLQNSAQMARNHKTILFENQNVTTGNQPFRAPINLPLFQWHGIPIQDKTKTVFENALDFTAYFEVILKGNGLPLDETWECLLPMCLSSYQLVWFQKQLAEKNLTWHQAKQIIERDYFIKNLYKNEKIGNSLSVLHAIS
ncbi:hypothetical protein DFQ28_004902 [Apophysomyces sp. BC1034]|nr:hypothetical protein DFQ28_004902 [Apophysomyces sp. BC1034]